MTPAPHDDAFEPEFDDEFAPDSERTRRADHDLDEAKDPRNHEGRE